MMRLLLHIATFVGIMATLFFIQWYAARRREGDESQSVFVYSCPAKLFGVTTVSILPLVILDIAQDPYLRTALFVVETTLIIYVIVLLTTRITLKLDSIEISSIFRTNAVQFSNVTEINVNESSQCYILSQNGKKHLKISFHILGVQALIESIEHKTGVKRENSAI